MPSRKEKVEQILKWWEEGRIKKVGNAYSVPSQAFVMGITPRLVNEVLKGKAKEDKHEWWKGGDRDALRGAKRYRAGVF